MQSDPGVLAGFPNPASNRHCDHHSDVHSLANPSFAHTAAADGNVYIDPFALSDSAPDCHINADPIANTGPGCRSIGNLPPARSL
jgi:hypothetical protein